MGYPYITSFISVRDAIRYAGNGPWKQLPIWLKHEYEKGNVIFTPRDIFIRIGGKEYTIYPSQYLGIDSSNEISILNDLLWKKIR